MREPRRPAASQSVRQLQKVLDQMPAVLWSTDTSLQFTSWSGAGLSAFQLDPVPAPGMSLAAFFRTEDPDVRPVVAHRRALEGESVAYEGSWWGRTFEVHVEPLRGREDRIVGTIGVALDITQRKKVEERLRESEERHRLLFERNLAGVFRSTLEGRFLDCNEACWKMFGCSSRDEFLSLPAADFSVDPDERVERLARLREQGALSGLEVCFRRRDGRLLWGLENLNLVFEPDAGWVVVGCVVDITDRKFAEEQVVHQAYHDALTGLPNRLLFADRLAVAVSHAHRVGGRLAVVYVDLDHFKLINDTLGHTVGD